MNLARTTHWNLRRVLQPSSRGAADRPDDNLLPLGGDLRNDLGWTPPR